MDRDRESLASQLIILRSRILGFVRRTAFRLTPAEIEDIFGEVCLAAIKGIADIRDPGSVRSWLFGIARLQTLAYLRRLERRLKPVTIETSEPAKEQLDPESYLILQEALIELQEALIELPQNERMAFVLVELEGLGQEEVCSRLNCGRTTLWSRLREAKRLLREYGMRKTDTRR